MKKTKLTIKEKIIITIINILSFAFVEIYFGYFAIVAIDKFLK